MLTKYKDSPVGQVISRIRSTCLIFNQVILQIKLLPLVCVLLVGLLVWIKIETTPPRCIGPVLGFVIICGGFIVLATSAVFIIRLIINYLSLRKNRYGILRTQNKMLMFKQVICYITIYTIFFSIVLSFIFRLCTYTYTGFISLRINSLLN